VYSDDPIVYSEDRREEGRWQVCLPVPVCRTSLHFGKRKPTDKSSSIMGGSWSPRVSLSPRLSLSRLLGGGLLLLALLVQSCYAVPQATTATPSGTEVDGEGFPSLSSGVHVSTGRLGTSEYTWIETWASTVTDDDAIPSSHTTAPFADGTSTVILTQSQYVFTLHVFIFVHKESLCHPWDMPRMFPRCLFLSLPCGRRHIDI
jgi:hypothetical protein